MRLLVTGSSGTIGTRLCEALLGREAAFTGVDWKPNRWLNSVEERTHHIDLREPPATWTAIPNDTDTIVHLAANARVYELVRNPTLAHDNVTTTLHTLEFARTRGIRRLILASSREVYGTPAGPLAREDDATLAQCESPYTASKIALEAFATSYARCYALEVVVLRFSNVYGMYDDSDRVIPLFLRQAKASQPLTVYGSQKTLDFTYIDDTVRGILLAIERFEEARGQTFNIATGTGTRILDIAEKINEACENRSPVKVEENRTGEVLRCTCDIAEARHVLGYAPSVDMEEGLRRTLAWYDAHT